MKLCRRKIEANQVNRRHQRRSATPLLQSIAPCRRSNACFTLIEVAVAATILALGVSMSVAVLGAARAQVLRAERRWGRQHLLSQASEFYLLAGPEAQMPTALLPQGFSSNCELLEAVDLPEHASESIAGWPGWRLAVFRISVYDTYRRLLGTHTVEKLVKDDDFY